MGQQPVPFILIPMTKNNDTSNSIFMFLKAKEQRTDWIILIVSCIIGYIVLKTCYPYPATISDSGTYVHAAAEDMFTFYRPFGYSYFLQIVHAISPGIHAVFIVQTILYFFSVAAFSFVLKYVIPPVSSVFWRILLFLFVFSPVAFYMSNALMSDLLFAVMIYFMLASFIYYIRTKGPAALCLFLISLFFALHIRYSAIMFPPLFICFFFMVKGKMRWIGIAATLAVTLIFYNQVKREMHKTTGFDQFSTGFDGWQLANNAMHAVPYIDLKPEKIKDPEMRILHQYMLTQTDVIKERTKDGTEAVAAFMWINDLPLKQFMFSYIQQTGQGYSPSWIWLGSRNYKEYGTYIISHYPLQFARYYYLPNSKEVFYPAHHEIIGKYYPINMKNVLEWYKIPENTNLDARYTIYSDYLDKPITISYLTAWLIIAVAAVLSIIWRKHLEWGENERKIFWIIVAAGILYYAATVFASPVSTRFWIPMNAIFFGVAYILYNRIMAYKKIKKI
ncbi:hypothetical protein ACFO6W_10365 [Dysgonomonas termitidis]|uniref:Glycosyltransferase RgtA/B/C/D-like domain-containing protein n=2 Tax=Dysgonomonas termitidis TaxID=1516126 RepID=A0ABV9KV70_9BACT